MNTYRTTIGVALACSLLTALILSGVVSGAETKAPFPRVKQIAKQDLADMEGKIVQIVELDIPPNGDSPGHRHPGHVFVYVVSGEIELAINDEPGQILKAGEVFYEPPMSLHRSARNTSATESAKAVAFMVLDEGETATQLDTGH